MYCCTLMGIQTITFTKPFMLGSKTSIDAYMNTLYCSNISIWTKIKLHKHLERYSVLHFPNFYSIGENFHTAQMDSDDKTNVLTFDLTRMILKFLYTGFSSFKIYAYVRKVRTFTCVKPSLVLKCMVTGFLHCRQQSILVWELAHSAAQLTLFLEHSILQVILKQCHCIKQQ